MTSVVPAEFTGQTVNGVMTAGQFDLYTFSVRASEIAGAAGGQLILRLALTGADVRCAPGTRASPCCRWNTTATPWWPCTASTRKACINCVWAAPAPDSLSLSIAGDLNLDGGVNGLDSGLMGVAGTRHRHHRRWRHRPERPPGAVCQLRLRDECRPAACPGSARGVHPRRAEDCRGRPSAQVAIDPDGDTVYYRIIGATHGSATLSADGRSVIFRPDAAMLATQRYRSPPMTASTVRR